jgi:hypothetical protein
LCLLSGWVFVDWKTSGKLSLWGCSCSQFWFRSILSWGVHKKPHLCLVHVLETWFFRSAPDFTYLLDKIKTAPNLFLPNEIWLQDEITSQLSFPMISSWILYYWQQSWRHLLEVVAGVVAVTMSRRFSIELKLGELVTTESYSTWDHEVQVKQQAVVFSHNYSELLVSGCIHTDTSHHASHLFLTPYLGFF